MNNTLYKISNTEVEYQDELYPDIPQAKRFLELIGAGQEFTFQTFDDRNKANRKLAKVFHGTLDEHKDSLVELNHQGAGVFVMINEGDGIIHEGSKTCRTAKNVISVRSIFIDLDDGASEKIKLVMNSPIKPSLVVESSTGKYHCYWQIADCASDKFTKVQSAFIAKFQSDEKVKDLPRVMRIPGFFHQKNEPCMTIIRDDFSDQSSGLKLNDVMSLNGISFGSSNKSTVKESEMPNFAFVDSKITFERNNALASVAGSLRTRGASEDEISTQLLNINSERCCPPLDEGEVLLIAKSISRYEPQSQLQPNDVLETLTDTGNADRFAKRYAESVRYVVDWGKFIIFDGHNWGVDANNRIMEFAKIVARDIYLEGNAVNDLKLRHEISRHSLRSQQLQRLNAIIELIKSIDTIAINSSVLNANDMLLCVKNGVVDLRTGELKKGRSEDYITQVAPVEYDETAKCPRFMQFITETFAEKLTQDVSSNPLEIDYSEKPNELIEYIHKALGYCLTGRTDEQCLMFGYGTGANGKTTLINLMLNLLGQDYALQTPMDTLMVKKNESASSNHLARLQNIRFVASTEVEDGARMSESLIKSMTGGDKIAARFLYKEFIEFTPKYKLFIAGNHKPLIRGTDEGIWRRIHLVPFDVTISKHKRDGALPEKLKSEMSGILNWLIEGCLKYQKERLALPPVMKEALEEYQDEMDTLGLWIKDCCTIGDDCRARGEQIYKSYSQWSLDNGFQSSSSAAFYRRISERFEKKRSSNGNYYSGISVNSVIP